jgi:DNA polymerase-1
MTTENGRLTPEQHTAAIFLGKHWPDEGNRNNAAGALAGGLLRARWTVETVEAFVEAVAEAGGDDEPQKRSDRVAPTGEKLKNKTDAKKVTGFPKLATYLKDGQNVVRQLRLMLGLTIDLEKLAEAKALPVDYLRTLGLHDLTLGGVGIPYRDGSGKTVEIKERTALVAKLGSYWPKKTLPMIYGEWRLEDGNTAGYRILVEGESDVWTLWYHNFPALGIPGSDTVSALQIGHVAKMQRLFVNQETDEAGTQFVQAVRNRLAEIGWTGDLRVVHLNPIKDPSDLHKQEPSKFRERFQQALDQAERVTVEGTTSAPDPWPDPLPLSEVPSAALFPIDVLPEPLQLFVREAATALPCPEDYVAVPLVVMAGIAIGASRALAIKAGHIQRSSLYAAVIGPPGSAKTPALDLTVEPTHSVEEQIHAAWEEAMEQYQTDLDEYEAELKEFKKKGGDRPKKPPRPILERLTVNDATAEALVPILKENPRGVGLIRDELVGWVQAMNQYREGGKGADQQFFLSAWSGAAVSVDRKKTHDLGPLRVRNPFISVIGGLTPDKLPALRGNGPRGRVDQDGFIDRVLMSFPAEPGVASENWLEISDGTRERWRAVLDKLRSLAMVPIQEGGIIKGYRPFVVKLTTDGRRAWQLFTEKHTEERNADDFPPHLTGPWSKLRGYAARLALIVHYIRWACGEIDYEDVDGESMTRAAALVAYFKSHARKVYAVIDADSRIALARRLLRIIVRDRVTQITRRDAYRAMRGPCKSVEDIDPILSMLETHGFIRPTQQPAPTLGRKPSRIYEIHPSTFGHNGHNGQNSAVWVLKTPSGGNSVQSVHSVQASEEENENDDDEGEIEENPERPPGQNGHNGQNSGEPEEEPLSSYFVVTDAEVLTMTVTAAIEESVVVGLDLETTGLDPRRDRIRLLTLATDRGTFLIDVSAVDPSPIFEMLAERPLVVHNAIFDLSFLRRLGFVPGTVHDTILMSRLLHGTRKGKRYHSLEECVRRELSQEIDKAEQKGDWSGNLTRSQLDYAARDAEVLRPLFEALDGKLKEAGLSDVTDIERRCLPAVVWLADSGVGFDSSAWNALAEEATKNAEALAGELDAAAPERSGHLSMGSQWLWDSPQQVKEAFHALGHDLESTDDDALAGIDHPLASLLRRYRAAQKLVTTYGTDWPKNLIDGRIHAGWLQIGADSGRMACKAPNLQNLPRDKRYRRCFVAPPGRVLVKADYSQIELRIAAKITKDAAMLAAYRDGVDLHTLTAQRVLGISEVTPEQRQLAKAINFGLLYGMGARGFRQYAKGQYGLDLTEEQAGRYRDAFFKAYPGLKRWHRSTPNNSIETRTLAGRRRANVQRFTEKLNFPVQGTGADGLKAALALLWERREQIPTAFPVLVVHDEIVIECDEDQAGAAGDWLKAAMIDGMEPLIAPVSVGVDVKVGRTWGGN